MAQKEGNELSALSSFFHQIGCVALMVYAYNNFGDLNAYRMAAWYAAPMLIGLIIQVGGIVATMRTPR